MPDLTHDRARLHREVDRWFDELEQDDETPVDVWLDQAMVIGAFVHTDEDGDQVESMLSIATTSKPHVKHGLVARMLGVLQDG